MSRENDETVRAHFETWNAGDMEAHSDIFDPDVIAWMPEGWPEPGPFVRRDAVLRQQLQMRETWDTDELELISDFIDVGDRVGVRFVWHGVGRGPESKQELTGVYTVRNGRIRGLEFFWNHDEALEILGLSEQTVSQNVDVASMSMASSSTSSYRSKLWCHP